MDPLSFLSTKIVISPEKELSLYKTFDLTATPKRGNGCASRAFQVPDHESHGFQRIYTNSEVSRSALRARSQVSGSRFQVWFEIWEFEFEISAGLPAVVCSQLVDSLP